LVVGSYITLGVVNNRWVKRIYESREMTAPDMIKREVFPIPDRPDTGLVTHDATDRLPHSAGTGIARDPVLCDLDFQELSRPITDRADLSMAAIGHDHRQAGTNNV
jgi:hypothetical protein